MLKLPICERTSLKLFIKVLRAYGEDQQRPKTQKDKKTLDQKHKPQQINKNKFYNFKQPKKSLQSQIRKLHTLGQPKRSYKRMIINNQILVLSKKREKTKIQGWMLGDIQKGMSQMNFTIKNFKKFLYHNQIQSYVIPKYNIGSHKRGRFDQAPRSHNLLYTPIAYT